MDLGIAGRTAIVSGGSKGIGRTTAELLARDGVQVGIAARGKDAIEETVAAIRDDGGTAIGIVADMCAADEVEGAVAEIREAFGPPDIAISNVHGPGPGDFFDLGDDDFRRAFDEMVLSVVHLTRAVVPSMREQRWGRLVNIGSGAAKEPPSELRHALANTTRAPVVTLQKTLANELGPDGITVNTVGTGWIATQRMLDYSEKVAAELGASREQFVDQVSATIPLRRPGTPTEMAGLIVFLCSELAGYITGQWIAVDGGLLRGAF
jgi:3-oxoacyl-[acyl-carrier protein] reductase